MSEYHEIDSAEESNEEIETIEAPKVAKRKPKKALEVETSMDDSDIPNPPPKPRGRPKKELDDVEKPVKIKRERTEAQRKNFEKCLETRKANIALRKEQKLLEQKAKEQEQIEKKQIIEKKILKKAKCLKKREILEQTALDDLPSDEDIPDVIIEKVMKKQKAKAQKSVALVAQIEPLKPNKYNFV